MSIIPTSGGIIKLMNHTHQECVAYAVEYMRMVGYIGDYMYAGEQNKAINANINASLNIARKNGYSITIRGKILSLHITTNGILNPRQRANTQ